MTFGHTHIGLVEAYTLARLYITMEIIASMCFTTGRRPRSFFYLPALVTVVRTLSND